MGLQILSTIALLCGSPAELAGFDSAYTPTEVLNCQKYYVNCLKQNTEDVSKCVLDREIKK